MLKIISGGILLFFLASIFSYTFFDFRFWVVPVDDARGFMLLVVHFLGLLIPSAVLINSND